MKLAFILSMPNIGSWNGKWSGANDLYAMIVGFGRKKENITKAIDILAHHPYFYRFSDGWTARIEVREVDAKEARKIRKLSRGFCGYEWMVGSILQKRCIDP